MWKSIDLQPTEPLDDKIQNKVKLVLPTPDPVPPDSRSSVFSQETTVKPS